MEYSGQKETTKKYNKTSKYWKDEKNERRKQKYYREGEIKKKCNENKEGKTSKDRPLCGLQVTVEVMSKSTTKDLTQC